MANLANTGVRRWDFSSSQFSESSNSPPPFPQLTSVHEGEGKARNLAPRPAKNPVSAPDGNNYQSNQGELDQNKDIRNSEDIVFS